MAGRGGAASKPARTAAKTPAAKGYKAVARKASVKDTAPKPAHGGVQTRRPGSTRRGAGRLDAVLAAQLEGIAHSLEQIGGLRADIDELRGQIGTIAQSVTTLAQAVETLLANDRQQKRNPDRQTAPARRRRNPDRAAAGAASETPIEELPDDQPASAEEETETEPSDSTHD